LSKLHRLLAWLPNVIAAALVVIGFFLPWMDGANAFDLRTFSGFDFARLVRNFEITAGSVPETGQIRATAVAVYLMPALAINGAFLYQISAFARSLRYAAGVALLLAAIYIVSMLLALLFLSMVHINQFADVVGPPLWGFGLTLWGALLLGWLGQKEMRQARPLSADAG
jgi:hypothetical protein